MLLFLGFMVTFVIGGMAGVLISVPAVDFLVHNTMFLVAHFHTMLIRGAVFGYFAGYIFWFPKSLGFKLDERLGRPFWWWIIGFYLAFIPLYMLGFLGSRGVWTITISGWQGLFIAAAWRLFWRSARLPSCSSR